MDQKLKDKIVYEIKDWILWIAIAIIVSTVVGNILGAALGNTTPLVAVMSGSMTHDGTTPTVYFKWMADHGFVQEQLAAFPIQNGFRKGDVLVVQQGPIDIGDVIVFHVSPGYPVIHRVINITEVNRTVYYNTKGDHNPVNDPWIVANDRVEGKAVFWIPLVGYIKVIPVEIWNWLT